MPRTLRSLESAGKEIADVAQDSLVSRRSLVATNEMTKEAREYICSRL